MRNEPHKHVIVASALTYQSGRDQLEGFFRYADTKRDWEVTVLPTIDANSLSRLCVYLKRNVDGIVIKGEGTPHLKDQMAGLSIPVVAIDSPEDGQPRDFVSTTICSDNVRIGQTAAEHFTRLGSFATYAYLRDIFNCEWSRIRRKAFADALPGKTVVDIPVTGELQKDRELLTDWLKAAPKPVALFAALDYAAAFVLSTCRELKIAVPEDIAVVGVDNDRLLCEHTRPKLSSIQPDHVGQGYAAAKELDLLMRHKTKPKGSRLVLTAPVGIVARESSAPVPPSVHLVRKIDAFLEHHALDPIDVADIVRETGVSSRLANLRFTQAYGHSIRAELTIRRLAAAKELLRTTDLPTGRIARRCGFKSTVVFSHLFKTHERQSPASWRKIRHN